ncbi:MAG: hypothetical protein ACOZAR_03630 [Patescibacteria group bacterium]
MKQINFKAKLGYFGRQIEMERVLILDLWRFFIVVTVLVLLGMVFRFEENKIFDSQVSNQLSRRIEQKIHQIIVNEGQYFSSYKTDSRWDYVLKNFPEMAYEPFVGLGRLDETKNGFFGDFDFKTFETFLPKSYRDSLYFSKGDSVLLIEPMGINEEKNEPDIVKERLIYDDIYPGVLVVRMFNSLGIKDYFIIKEENSVREIDFKLNYNGGRIEKEPNGTVAFFDESGEAKFVISKLIGVDSSGKRIDDKLEYRLEDNILKIILNIEDSDMNYPLMVDPFVYFGGSDD